MTYDEATATARRMTMGERIARLNEIPTLEAPKDLKDIWGEPDSFNCCWCGKHVEIPLRSSIRKWAYCATSAGGGKRLRACSWSCLQAWRNDRRQKMAVACATRGKPYTPEEDKLIIELHGKKVKWEEIAMITGRNINALRNHYNNYLK